MSESTITAKGQTTVPRLVANGWGQALARGWSGMSCPTAG